MPAHHSKLASNRSCAGMLSPGWMFAMSWLSLVMFHAAHWEEYYVGELVMGALTGPTEAVLAIVGFLYVAAALGPEALAVDALGCASNQIFFFLG